MICHPFLLFLVNLSVLSDDFMDCSTLYHKRFLFHQSISFASRAALITSANSIDLFTNAAAASGSHLGHTQIECGHSISLLNQFPTARWLQCGTLDWKVVSPIPTHGTAILHQGNFSQPTHTQGEYLQAQMGRTVPLA